MALTPIDVQQKTFKIALRGYAEDEVDEFLDEVVISLRDLEQQLRDAEERVSFIEDQLKANRETEDALRRTFVVAQRTADTVVSEAREEADRILAEANSKANLLTEEQLGERERLITELVEMREKSSRFKAALADLVGEVRPELNALDDELAATEYQPLEDDAPRAAGALAEQDAMFQPADDTAEMTGEFTPPRPATPSDDHTDEAPRSERLARVLEGEDVPVDPDDAGEPSSWEPITAESTEGADATEPAEPLERFEWSRERSAADAAKRPWERG